MSKSTTELVTRVLVRIGTLAEGDTPSSAEAAAVAGFYGNVYQEYERLGLAFWDEDAIPEYVFEALVDLLAGRKSSDDGWPRPELETSGDARIRLMAANEASGEVLQTDYF